MKTIGKILGIIAVWGAAYMADQVFGFSVFYYWAGFVTGILALV